MKPQTIHQNIQTKTHLVLAALFLLIVLSGVEYTEQIDTGSLIRIHVLANSNTEADQALKLQVKDSVVRTLEPLLKNSSSIEESRRIIRSSFPQMEAAALETIRQNGYSYTVSMQYGRFDFPVKYYGSFSLPAGNYEALRILIGEGQGQNWWCVLFPPLCFTDSNVSPSGKYTDYTPDTEVVIKFKSIEWLKNKKRELELSNSLSEVRARGLEPPRDCSH